MSKLKRPVITKGYGEPDHIRTNKLTPSQRRQRRVVKEVLAAMKAKQAYDEFWSDPCWSEPTGQA